MQHLLLTRSRLLRADTVLGHGMCQTHTVLALLKFTATLLLTYTLPNSFYYQQLHLLKTFIKQKHSRFKISTRHPCTSHLLCDPGPGERQVGGGPPQALPKGTSAAHSLFPYILLPVCYAAEKAPGRLRKACLPWV